MKVIYVEWIIQAILYNESNIPSPHLSHPCYTDVAAQVSLHLSGNFYIRAKLVTADTVREQAGP